MAVFATASKGGRSCPVCMSLKRLGLTIQGIFAPSQPRGEASKGHSSMSGLVEIATFGEGCFWGTEKLYRTHWGGKGLLDCSVGFISGRNPRSDRCEAIRIEYDPDVVTYEQLVEFMFQSHDPTMLNYQGNDTGTEVRSAIFVHNVEQRKIAERVRAEIQMKRFNPDSAKIVTTIEDAGTWFEASEGHQQYLLKNPNGYHCYTHYLHW